MTDPRDEATAKEVLYKINEWRNRILGGYEMKGPGAVDLIAAALTQARREWLEEAITIIRGYQFTGSVTSVTAAEFAKRRLVDVIRAKLEEKGSR